MAADLRRTATALASRGLFVPPVSCWTPASSRQELAWASLADILRRSDNYFAKLNLFSSLLVLPIGGAAEHLKRGLLHKLRRREQEVRRRKAEGEQIRARQTDGGDAAPTDAPLEGKAPEPNRKAATLLEGPGTRRRARSCEGPGDEPGANPRGDAWRGVAGKKTRQRKATAVAQRCGESEELANLERGKREIEQTINSVNHPAATGFVFLLSEYVGPADLAPTLPQPSRLFPRVICPALDASLFAPPAGGERARERRGAFGPPCAGAEKRLRDSPSSSAAKKKAPDECERAREDREREEEEDEPEDDRKKEVLARLVVAAPESQIPDWVWRPVAGALVVCENENNREISFLFCRPSLAAEALHQLVRVLLMRVVALSLCWRRASEQGWRGKVGRTKFVTLKGLSLPFFPDAATAFLTRPCGLGFAKHFEVFGEHTDSGRDGACVCHRRLGTRLRALTSAGVPPGDHAGGGDAGAAAGRAAGPSRGRARKTPAEEWLPPEGDEEREAAWRRRRPEDFFFYGISESRFLRNWDANNALLIPDAVPLSVHSLAPRATLTPTGQQLDDMPHASLMNPAQPGVAVVRDSRRQPEAGARHTLCGKGFPL
ncbi:hypothetical protein BESB_023200 [Besnoitia besnoiti]|uniref:Uncharacterized protein n=1 Tax=Besnoitia besnoiti TaxID=94643 RepID=A0A2A9LZL7_BESBE|nr:hypothetical protein BESB_023200 [Besnoitia besnoiti]PFH31828.1 hypothetical protein BESB_023200 [Besnoitia besnoiti]